MPANPSIAFENRPPHRAAYLRRDIDEPCPPEPVQTQLPLARKAGFWKLRQYYPCLGILPAERR